MQNGMKAQVQSRAIVYGEPRRTALGNWTDERVKVLVQRWADGLSASQIAAILGGVTRNAVIGKVHRLGLPRRASPILAPSWQFGRKRKRRPPAVREPRPPKLRAAPTRPSALPDIAPEGAFTLMERPLGSCAFLYGDGLARDVAPTCITGAADLLACARPATRGCYCAAHAAALYQPRGEGAGHVSR